MESATVTVTTSATRLTTAKPASQRRWITITNESAVTVRIGGSGVTSTTGMPLAAGMGMTIENSTLARPAANAWYGIVASGSVSLSVTEGM